MSVRSTHSGRTRRRPAVATSRTTSPPWTARPASYSKQGHNSARRQNRAHSPGRSGNRPAILRVESSKRTEMRRVARVAVWIAIGTITLVGAAELMARTVLGLKTLSYTRPYHPIFVSGDLLRDDATQSELIKATGSVESYGYEGSGLGLYFWNGRNIPRSSTDLSDFLFSHYLSQYDHAEVDDIVCRRVDASMVYVLGGS